MIYDSYGLQSNKATLLIILEVLGIDPDLKGNNIMSANGDGQNDALIIGYANLNKKSKFWVIDENGTELFYTENYKNDWSGTDNKNNKLPSGVYFYTYKEFNDNGQEEKVYSNFCQILR